jgi:hypothetical protein
VDRYLVRDADSLLSVQQRVAVDEWLASEFAFHMIRDWYSHTDLILAGLWGGTSGNLPGFEKNFKDYYNQQPYKDRKLDQNFLSEKVWSVFRRSCLIHDDFFGNFDARPFPLYGKLPPGQHVGQNYEWLLKKREKDGK